MKQVATALKGPSHFDDNGNIVIDNDQQDLQKLLEFMKADEIRLTRNQIIIVNPKGGYSIA